MATQPAAQHAVKQGPAGSSGVAAPFQGIRLLHGAPSQQAARVLATSKASAPWGGGWLSTCKVCKVCVAATLRPDGRCCFCATRSPTDAASRALASEGEGLLRG